MIHFEDWPHKSVPKDRNKLLKLIQKVEDCKHQGNGKHPIVVMCRYVCEILH